MTNKRISFLYIVLISITIAAFIPLPYYVTKPGGAHELEPIVHVSGGDENDTSTLMLTTIQMGPANIYTYAWASMQEYQNILPKEQVRYKHESDKEYDVRQFHLMDTSQQNAVTVAFDEAGKPYEWIYNGVYVLGVFPGMPAEKTLQAGDRLTAVDGQAIESSRQLTDYIQSKKAGEQVTLSFIRNTKERKEAVEIRSFAELNGKTGIGISLADDRTLKSDPSVELEASEIGGPSAGLMFSLEIYDQIVEADIAAGMKIAGTGTISPDGTVGRIGGISQKVVAADRAGAKYFFAPDDPATKKAPEAKTNYEEAKKAAEDIGTDMVIVPVRTFSDAVEYLKTQAGSK